MPSSSKKQQQFDFSFPDRSSSGGVRGADSEVESLPAGGQADSSTSGASFPDFGVSSDLYAAAARNAGRLNAANVSDKELEDLLGERQRLLDKQFGGTMKRADEVRLRYVQWSLDRVEDARYGQSLDALEGWIEQYERFQRDVESLQGELMKHKRGRRK